jgi:hypothetical protein
MDRVCNSVRETNEYDRFVLTEKNRAMKKLTTPKARELRESLQNEGWFDNATLLCTKEGSKLIIWDGQHRFRLAIEQNLPVKYVIVNNPPKSLAKLQSGVGTWNLEDYFNLHTNEGVENFQYTKSFAEQNNIPIPLATALLFGDLPGNSNSREEIKNGKFRIRDIDYAEKVVSMIHFMRGLTTLADHRAMISAIAKIVRTPIVEIERLKNKLSLNKGMIYNAHTTDGFLEMFDEIYNRQSRDKFPLKFEVEEEMRMRRATVGVGK